MAEFDPIFEEIFDEVFGEVSKISKDLTQVTEIDKSKIGKAITTKLKFGYYTELNDFFDDAIKEIKEFARSEINKSTSSTVTSEIVADIKGHDDLEALLRSCVYFVEKLEKLQTGFEECSLDVNDMGVELLECVSFLCQIRVKNDIIPLVNRGLYSDKIREAISIWQEKSLSLIHI